jgi:class 3 adenylate cyclase/tetratricopeptide (TPR) repeat protein
VGNPAEESSCPECGAALRETPRFCPNCGAALAERHGQQEERKLVSVLFVDLVDFTARSDKADPEDVRELLQLYHSEAKRRIEQYGGVLEKFIGDAVMAVFGAPTAHGDDAERAVRAGLGVLEGIDDLNRAHSLGLAARAAVNTGEAVVSLHSRQGDALATGDVVNTAARLQSAAPVGGVLVGEETYRATRESVAYEPLAAVDAKGKQEPLAAWLAVAPRGEPGDRPAVRAPLIGRSREVELMRSVWSNSLAELRPHLVTVLGPPGIGKSRLCREFGATVDADGGRFIRGRCLPYEERVGYQAFSGVVEAAGGVLGSDSPQVRLEKLELIVARVMPPDETKETASHIALLLGLTSDAEAPRPKVLFFYARRFLERIGIEQPTVVVFEDIHWAQASELELLQYLGQHLRDSPVMLVAAARPELLDQQPTWGSGLTAQTTILLDPLRPEDAETLAGHLVRPTGEQPVDLASVIETAGGNPLFLEELAASLAEARAGDQLPVTVREAIAARVDALPPAARSTLLSAAVVGRTFWRSVVEAIGETGDIDEALGVLEARDLVRRDPSSQLGGDAQFTFKHMLIRDVAYSTVPRAVRRDRHTAVARYVEERLAGATETLSTILAHHWREAGEPARAIPYLVAAAEAARRSWAHDSVIELYSLAIELADDPGLRRRLQLDRGTALVELWDMERAAEELSALVTELEGQERLDALIALGHAYVWTERDAETLATAEAATVLLEEVDDGAAKAAVLAMESQGLAMRGADGDLARAYELGERALALWVPGTRRLALNHHLTLHADTTYWAGEYERSLELARQSRRVATDVHVVESMVRSGGWEALTLAGLGRHEEAIAIWDELFAVADDLGHPRQVLLNYSTLAYRELYDLDEARRRSEEALELASGVAFGMPRQFAGSDLLFTQLLAGDVGSAQSAWPERWESADHATAWTTWLIRGRLAVARAEIALRAESPDAAVEWAGRSLEIARRTRRRKYEARSLELLGQALAGLGRRDEALAALNAAVPITDALVGPPARWHARATLGRMAHALGDDNLAAVSFDDAARLIEQFAVTLTPERSRRLLAAPQIEEILSAAGRRLVR